MWEGAVKKNVYRQSCDTMGHSLTSAVGCTSYRDAHREERERKKTEIKTKQSFLAKQTSTCLCMF